MAKMVRMMVTCRELRYDRKTLLYGAQFDADERHVKALKAIGKATDDVTAPPLRVADPQPAKRAEPRPVQQASFVAEGEAAPADGRRRRYRRTDMRSED